MSDFSEFNRLDLSNQYLGDEGVKEKLAQALKNNSAITGLFLSKNNIGPEGAKAIAEVLKDNIGVKILMLGVNNIGEKEQRQ